MQTNAMVTGSFDPITNGHSWMAGQACAIADKVYFAIASNPTKKGMFSPDEREALAKGVLYDVLSPEDFRKIEFVQVQRKFTAKVAKKLGVTVIVRGIRNHMDFAYESDIQQFNQVIEPSIRHFYVIPPGPLTCVSSSAVKGYIGTEDWEEEVAKWVHPTVLNAMIEYASK
jgi:pantetheine-phosphate adenylyltransferase